MLYLNFVVYLIFFLAELCQVSFLPKTTRTIELSSIGSKCSNDDSNLPHFINRPNLRFLEQKRLALEFWEHQSVIAPTVERRKECFYLAADAHDALNKLLTVANKQPTKTYMKVTDRRGQLANIVVLADVKAGAA